MTAEVSGWYVRGRPRSGWMDGVKLALSSRWMIVAAARQCERYEGVESPGAYGDD